MATGGDPARLAAAIAMLDGHGADGAILLDRQPASQPDGAPPPLPLVTADDLPDVGAAGIGHVVAHLVRRGHRAIGHLAGPADRIAGQARLAAFRSAMTAAGLFVTAIEPCPAFSIDAGMRGASALLARRPGLTALVAADDRLAVGALDAIAAAGQRCPQDVSVAGIGDLPLAGRLTPPLTSVRIDTTAAGRRAVRRLLDFLGEAGAPPENPVTADLIERGSTGAAPAR
jgi:LacI family transcriptional regulator